MTTTEHPTSAELVAQAHKLRPRFRAPMQWAYECLSTLHDAIDSARRTEEAAHDVLMECDSPTTDEVLEVMGAMQFHDVVSAIAQLIESYTGCMPQDSDEIPIELVSERRDQFLCSYDRTADGFDPPFPLEERIHAVRADHRPMSVAGERTIARILATAADQASLDDWRMPEARTTAGPRDAAVARLLPFMRRSEAEAVVDALLGDLSR